MRVELRDGQWVDIRERITHGEDKEIKRAFIADRVNGPDMVLRKFITAWKMNDPDGKPIPLEDGDALDRMPEDLADEVYGAANDHYGRATVPNPATPPPSGSGSSAAASPSGT